MMNLDKSPIRKLKDIVAVPACLVLKFLLLKSQYPGRVLIVSLQDIYSLLAGYWKKGL
jgi:hypothetical protein